MRKLYLMTGLVALYTSLAIPARGQSGWDGQFIKPPDGSVRVFVNGQRFCARLFGNQRCDRLVLRLGLSCSWLWFWLLGGQSAGKTKAEKINNYD